MGEVDVLDLTLLLGTSAQRGDGRILVPLRKIKAFLACKVYK
jgi:hypothetical protein